MSVVLLYCGGTHVTRTWSMVTPDTSLFGRRTRAPAPLGRAAPAMRPRARAPRVRRFVLLMCIFPRSSGARGAGAGSGTRGRTPYRLNLDWLDLNLNLNLNLS
jgi:hypothetical protein